MTEAPPEQSPQERLAHIRTDLAQQRTILASERTFAGWVRTSLTTIGLAFGFAGLMRDVEPGWLVHMVSIALIVTSGFMQAIAYLRYRNLARAHDRALGASRVHGMPLWWVGFITGALFICTVAGVLILTMYQGT